MKWKIYLKLFCDGNKWKLIYVAGGLFHSRIFRYEHCLFLIFTYICVAAKIKVVMKS